MKQPPLGFWTMGLVFVFGLGLMGEKAPAAEKNSKQKVAVTPQEAGPEFQVQGEYTGQLSGGEQMRKFGVQVIALGEGQFRAIGYPGGLPGDGWTGKTKLQAEGQRTNGKTVLKFKNETKANTGLIKEKTLILKNKQGEPIARLKRIVRKSPTLGQKPPKNAVVLFDGTSAENFKGGRMSDDGLLIQGATSKPTFQDCKLHLEFRLAFMPHARGQGRSNSGCYLQGRYEVQILDSFGLKGKNNECGGIYGVKAPDVNMCLPPLQWQTYDVDFTAARFRDGKKMQNARMSVWHNGVLIHEDVEIPRATRAAPLKEGPKPGPVYLQDHGNPLRFRNIWVVEK